MKKRQIIVAALSLALAAANSVPALAAAAPAGEKFPWRRPTTALMAPTTMVLPAQISGSGLISR